MRKLVFYGKSRIPTIDKVYKFVSGATQIDAQELFPLHDPSQDIEPCIEMSSKPFKTGFLPR
jgi:hypothetical protein